LIPPDEGKDQQHLGWKRQEREDQCEKHRHRHGEKDSQRENPPVHRIEGFRGSREFADREIIGAELREHRKNPGKRNRERVLADPLLAIEARQGHEQRKRDEIAYQLKRLEEQKDAASTRAKEVYDQLDDSRERLERIKARIIKQGRERQQEIIDQARSESRLLLAGTRRKIDYQLREAKENLRTEMVDSAVDIALERLPQQITAADNQKLLEKYLTETNT